jgi:hypothetical protein
MPALVASRCDPRAKAFRRSLGSKQTSYADSIAVARKLLHANCRMGPAHGMFVTGTSTPREYIAATLDYNLRNGIAELISCPTLVLDAEEDMPFFKGQLEELRTKDLTLCPAASASSTSASPLLPAAPITRTFTASSFCLVYGRPSKMRPDD